MKAEFSPVGSSRQKPRIQRSAMSDAVGSCGAKLQPLNRRADLVWDEIGRALRWATNLAIRFPAIGIDVDYHFRPPYDVLAEKQDQRTLGTARPYPLWRLHSSPQSSSVDQYSEKPPEHLASTVAGAMRRSVVTRHCLSKKLDAENGACAAWWVSWTGDRKGVVEGSGHFCGLKPWVSSSCIRTSRCYSPSRTGRCCCAPLLQRMSPGLHGECGPAIRWQRRRA
jgi:hypothetical protein